MPRRRRPGKALVRPIRAVGWELRGAWARGRRISMSLDSDVDRVEGYVRSVSPTDAFAIVDDGVFGKIHVPLAVILAVHLPSRLGDSRIEPGEEWVGVVPEALRRDPRQTSLDLND